MIVLVMKNSYALCTAHIHWNFIFCLFIWIFKIFGSAMSSSFVLEQLGCFTRMNGIKISISISRFVGTSIHISRRYYYILVWDAEDHSIWLNLIELCQYLPIDMRNVVFKQIVHKCLGQTNMTRNLHWIKSNAKLLLPSKKQKYFFEIHSVTFNIQV